MVEIEDGNGQDGNQRREEWAALARRCTSLPSLRAFTPLLGAPLHSIKPFS